jgi:hypothetical protein
MRTNWGVGDRIRAAGEEGTITEVLSQRGAYRVKLDSGRGICTDEKLVLAPREGAVPAEETPEPEDSREPVVVAKVIRGPRKR